MRVYLPATIPRLRYWLSVGQAHLIDPGSGDLAYAVTPTLREWYREGEIDELEHIASLDAALGSLELLQVDPLAPRRRVVVAADVDDTEVTVSSSRGRSAVLLPAPVALSRWACALVDSIDADRVVAAAAARVDAVAQGDADAQFAIDEAVAQELGWYAVQELPDLVS
jgi:hypothetical protein